MAEWFKRIFFAPEPTDQSPSPTPTPKPATALPSPAAPKPPSPIHIQPAPAPTSPPISPDQPSSSSSSSSSSSKQPTPLSATPTKAPSAHKQGQLIPTAAASRNVRASEPNVALQLPLSSLPPSSTSSPASTSPRGAPASPRARSVAPSKTSPSKSTTTTSSSSTTTTTTHTSTTPSSPSTTSSTSSTSSSSSSPSSSTEASSSANPDLTIEPGAIVCKTSNIQGDVTIGTGTVVHPKASIIAEGGPIIIGPNNIVEEFALIKNEWLLDPSLPLGKQLLPRGPMIIGSHNLFEVCCEVTSARIGEFNRFGPRAKVCTGLKIGSHCVVGAATVVSRSMEDGTGAYGSGTASVVPIVGVDLEELRDQHVSHLKLLAESLPHHNHLIPPNDHSGKHVAPKSVPPLQIVSQ